MKRLSLLFLIYSLNSGVLLMCNTLVISSPQQLLTGGSSNVQACYVTSIVDTISNTPPPTGYDFNTLTAVWYTNDSTSWKVRVWNTQGNELTWSYNATSQNLTPIALYAVSYSNSIYLIRAYIDQTNAPKLEALNMLTGNLLQSAPGLPSALTPQNFRVGKPYSENGKFLVPLSYFSPPLSYFGNNLLSINVWDVINNTLSITTEQAPIGVGATEPQLQSVPFYEDCTNSNTINPIPLMFYTYDKFLYVINTENPVSNVLVCNNLITNASYATSHTWSTCKSFVATWNKNTLDSTKADLNLWSIEVTGSLSNQPTCTLLCTPITQADFNLLSTPSFFSSSSDHITFAAAYSKSGIKSLSFFDYSMSTSQLAPEKNLLSLANQNDVYMDNCLIAAANTSNSVLTFTNDGKISIWYDLQSTPSYQQLDLFSGGVATTNIVDITKAGLIAIESPFASPGRIVTAMLPGSSYLGFQRFAELMAQDVYDLGNALAQTQDDVQTTLNNILGAGSDDKINILVQVLLDMNIHSDDSQKIGQALYNNGTSPDIVTKIISGLSSSPQGLQLAAGTFISVLKTIFNIRSRGPADARNYIKNLMAGICVNLPPDFVATVFSESTLQALQFGISVTATFLALLFESSYCSPCNGILSVLFDDQYIDKQDLGKALGLASQQSSLVQDELCACLVPLLAAQDETTSYDVLYGLLTENNDPSLLTCVRDASLYFSNMQPVLALVLAQLAMLTKKSCLCSIIVTAVSQEKFDLAAQLYVKTSSLDRSCICSEITSRQAAQILIRAMELTYATVLPDCVCDFAYHHHWVNTLVSTIMLLNNDSEKIERLILEVVTNTNNTTYCCQLIPSVLAELVKRSVPVSVIGLVLATTLHEYACSETIICDWFSTLLKDPLLGTEAAATLLAQMMASSDLSSLAHTIISVLCLCQEVDMADVIANAFLHLTRLYPFTPLSLP